MKKSTCFYLAQMAVLGATGIGADDKLEILRVLMAEEDIRKLCEKSDEEKTEFKSASATSATSAENKESEVEAY